MQSLSDSLSVESCRNGLCYLLACRKFCRVIPGKKIRVITDKPFQSLFTSWLSCSRGPSFPIASFPVWKSDEKLGGGLGTRLLFFSLFSLMLRENLPSKVSRHHCFSHTLHSCRYKGHKNSDYKLDSSLSHDDAHIVSGSEDGRICFWDLVEVQLQFKVLALGL